MIFMNLSEDKAYLDGYFKAIIRYFLNLMIDKKIMLFKTGLLEVNLKEVIGESSAMIEFKNTAYEITLDINSKDILKDILFKFAHEVGHLILMPITDLAPYTDYNSSDRSYAITTLTRKTKDGRQYGTTFEELFCNLQAYNAVCSVLGCKEIDIEPSVRRDIDLCQRIINSFEIDKRLFWDEYLYEGSHVQCNSFLFGVTRGVMSYSIHRYDKFMGDGSWRNLMLLVKDYAYGDSLKKDELDVKIDNFLSFFKVANSASVKEAVIAS